jgi:hypothetical protein
MCFIISEPERLYLLYLTCKRVQPDSLNQCAGHQHSTDLFIQVNKYLWKHILTNTYISMFSNTMTWTGNWNLFTGLNSAGYITCNLTYRSTVTYIYLIHFHIRLLNILYVVLSCASIGTSCHLSSQCQADTDSTSYETQFDVYNVPLKRFIVKKHHTKVDPKFLFDILLSCHVHLTK